MVSKKSAARAGINNSNSFLLLTVVLAICRKAGMWQTGGHLIHNFLVWIGQTQSMWKGGHILHIYL